jgi:hypothetical protein
MVDLGSKVIQKGNKGRKSKAKRFIYHYFQFGKDQLDEGSNQTPSLAERPVCRLLDSSSNIFYIH